MIDCHDCRCDITVNGPYLGGHQDAWSDHADQSDPWARVALLVAVESFTFDRAGIGATYVHPGAILRASNPVVKGHEALFRPSTLIAEFEPDLELTEIPVRVTGEADPDAPFSWLQMKIAGTVQRAETSLFNIGE